MKEICGKIFLERNSGLIKMEELDLWHLMRKKDAIYNGLLAAMMLNVAMVWFFNGEVLGGVLQLACAAGVGVNCIHLVVWTKRSKRLIKFVEEELKKKGDRINAENT